MLVGFNFAYSYIYSQRLLFSLLLQEKWELSHEIMHSEKTNERKSFRKVNMNHALEL